MSEYKTVLFDLDGTLTDPADGITNSVLYALKKHGYPLPPKEDLYFFIGPPLIESFMQYCKIDKAKANIMVESYREYFANKGIFENALIPYAENLLIKLKQRKITVALATSKPLVFAEKILKHFNIYKYFDIISGSNLDGTLTDKAEVISDVLKRLENFERDNTAMIGDRSYDIMGAVKNEITPIGVLCGYGTNEELKQAGAVHIARNLQELENFLI